MGVGYNDDTPNQLIDKMTYNMTFGLTSKCPYQSLYHYLQSDKGKDSLAPHAHLRKLQIS
jgi:hypothetical protein